MYNKLFFFFGGGAGFVCLCVFLPLFFPLSTHACIILFYTPRRLVLLCKLFSFWVNKWSFPQKCGVVPVLCCDSRARRNRHSVISSAHVGLLADSLAPHSCLLIVTVHRQLQVFFNDAGNDHWLSLCQFYFSIHSNCSFPFSSMSFWF